MREKSATTGIRTILLAVGACLTVSTAAAQGPLLDQAAIVDVVNLHNDPGDNCKWTRMKPDGIPVPFVPPLNYWLVITSVQWSSGFDFQSHTRRKFLRLFRGTEENQHTTQKYNLLATVDGGAADEWGITSGQAVFPTGLVVYFGSNPLQLCYNWGDFGEHRFDDNVTLQGYLVFMAKRSS